jgi:multiple sugar transport system ATP-binding protein
MNFLPGELEGDTVKLPIGTLTVPEELRHRLESGSGGGRRGVIAGLRPEHFEDAAVIADRSHGVTFKTTIDVLESMGSEYYAYFTVGSEKVSSSELDELAKDAGAADLPHSRGGTQVVARLAAESRARQGEELDLFFDSRHLQLFDTESGRSLLGGDGDAAIAQRPVPEPAATG